MKRPAKNDAMQPVISNSGPARKRHAKAAAKYIPHTGGMQGDRMPLTLEEGGEQHADADELEGTGSVGAETEGTPSGELEGMSEGMSETDDADLQ